MPSTDSAVVQLVSIACWAALRVTLPAQTAFLTAFSTPSLVAEFGLPVDHVRVIYTRGAGGYGLNGADTVSYDAALLSQAVAKPVRVQLSRKDEMAWENYGNAYVIDQRVGVDASGTIVVRSSCWTTETVR